MIDIDALTMKAFRALPLVIEGESKEVRYAGNGRVVIRLKPTIYSYTHNRAGIVPGSSKARLRTIRALLLVLHQAHISHTYEQVNDRWIVSQLVLQPAVKGGPLPFRPSDMDAQAIAALPVATPLEVVVKRVHSGTPKHRYWAMDTHPMRDGRYIATDQPYPKLVVRFDWRNPMHSPTGERLADEVLPEAMAEWFMDAQVARQTAVKTFLALEAHLADCGLELWDVCFFIGQDGRVVFGEISPDGMRVRAADGGALDKDLWRSGGSSDQVLKKWQELAELLSNRKEASI